MGFPPWRDVCVLTVSQPVFRGPARCPPRAEARAASITYRCGPPGRRSLPGTGGGCAQQPPAEHLAACPGRGGSARAVSALSGAAVLGLDQHSMGFTARWLGSCTSPRGGGSGHVPPLAPEGSHCGPAWPSHRRTDKHCRHSAPRPCVRPGSRTGRAGPLASEREGLGLSGRWPVLRRSQHPRHDPPRAECPPSDRAQHTGPQLRSTPA